MRARQIQDAGDPRVDVYQGLRSDAAVRRHGFIAEGWVVLEKALARGRYPLASILVCDKHSERLSDLLAGAGADVPVYLALQGVLAYGARPDLPSADNLLAATLTPALVVCAVGVNDPDNMGAIFRNAAAFGASAVLLDATCCDPLYRRAIRVSVGAALTTPFAQPAAGEDLLKLLLRHDLHPVALSPSGATPLKALVPALRTAVIVGAEGPGLPETLLAQAQVVRIPMADGFDSLNVATALAVALNRLRGDAPE